ncbi:MAG: PCMD domain-containing protein [Bacteroidales bacterium]|nr:PCMD domain-containing protein [Candidatus Sodaliphilus fimicaballi]
MKRLVLSLLTIAAATATSMAADKVVPLKFGDFDQWVTRHIKESAVIGGETKTIYEIGPTRTIDGAKAYTPGSSPWATSNVYAKVMGVVKTSNAVFPDTHGSGKCVKMTTMLEHVKAVGVINMDVLVSGSIFLGQMFEPVSSTKNPYSKMEMGIPFTQRPKYLQFDYKLNAPTGDRTYSSGFGAKKTVHGRDYAEVYILLQRRWEDAKGNLHAARVGTGRQRFGATTANWVSKHRIEVWYGDCTSHKGYQSYMGLLNTKDRAYYARNSKGKMVPVIEEQWDDANATPTHMLVMASSGCGTAYVGTLGMTLWLDNVALVY